MLDIFKKILNLQVKLVGVGMENHFSFINCSYSELSIYPLTVYTKSSLITLGLAVYGSTVVPLDLKNAKFPGYQNGKSLNPLTLPEKNTFS